MNKTTISWCDYTWNPTAGCTSMGPECDNCYAAAVAHRFKASRAFGDLLADATAKDEAIWRLNELAEYLPVEEYMRKHRMTLAQLGREMAGKLAVAVNCFPNAERLFDVEVRTRV